MPTVVDQLQARVQRALAHFPELRRQIPAAELRSPQHLLAWMSAAAGLDPKGAGRPEFQEALGAVQKWQAAQDLSDRAVQLYHDPKVIAMAGDKRDYYLAHPEEAYAALIANVGTGGSGLAGERNRQLRHELALAFRESMDLQTEFGVATSEGPAPIPSDPGRREADFKALLKERVDNMNTFRPRGQRSTWTPEKEARLQSLAGVTAGATEEEAAAHRKALGIPPAPTKPSGEYDALLTELVNDRRNFSPEKQARLEHLATPRAAEAGLFETGSEGTQENDDV